MNNSQATRTLRPYKRIALSIPLLLGAALWASGCGGGAGPTGAGGGGGGPTGPIGPFGPITASIQTIAGTGASGSNGTGRPLRQTSLYWPQDTYVDRAGRLWIIDWNNHRVLRANGPQGVAEIAVGSGFIGDTRTGPANQADLNHPTSICEDAQGRMVMAGWHNWTIKRINLDGNLEVVVGRGIGPATGGDGGPATQALLDLGSSAEYDAAGNLYISEQGARRIRKVDAVTGMITTFAGTGVPGYGGDGGPAAAAQFNVARGSDAVPSFKMAIRDDRLYIADSLNHRIRVIDLGSGIIDTFVGTGEEGYSGDGGPARQAKINHPTDVCFGPDGSLYIADAHNHVIRRVRPDGTITTVAGNGTSGFSGDGGVPQQAQLNDPSGVFVDRTGILFIADTLNHRIRAVKVSD